MSAASPSRVTRITLGAVALLLAATILGAALRPAPWMSLERHWAVFAIFGACALALMVTGWWLVGRPYRWVAAVGSVALISLAALAHPVCVLIPDSQRPSFETVMPLAVRAARGEPFCELEGQWYQCKSFISRALFF